jgi:hypothetical protein
MLKLLLDEHISPDVSAGLRTHSPRLVVRSMTEWEQGAFLGQGDAACLRQAASQRLTLVTYDRRTIAPLLKSWAEEGREHGGVIFIDDKTICPADIGGLVQALARLNHIARKWDWTNRVCFLRR